MNYSDKTDADEINRANIRRKVRAGYRRFILSQQPNVAFTMHFNKGGMHLDPVLIHMSNLMKDFDRKVIGRRYLKRKEKRTRGIFVIESLEDAAHVHGALRIHPTYLTPDLIGDTLGHMYTRSKKLVPSSSVDLELLKPVRDDDGLLRKSPDLWVRYLTKYLCYSVTSEDIFFAEEFHKNP